MKKEIQNCATEEPNTKTVILRDKVRQDVCDYATFEDATAQVYPYSMSAEDILANKNGVLDAIVEDILCDCVESETEADSESIHAAIERHAGVSCELN